MTDWIDIGLWVMQGVLAAAFMMSGALKLFMYEKARESLFWVKDVPRPVVAFIGASELAGALGIVLPRATGILPWLTPVAATGLALVMALAIGFHLRRLSTHERRLELQAAAYTGVQLVLAVAVAVGRFVVRP